MATTYRQLLNRVLLRLGNDEVPDLTTSLTDTHHRLIGNFLNDVKEEAEALNWRALRQTLPVTVLASTNVATVIGANERSRMLRIQDADTATVAALAYDVTTASAPYALMEMDLAVLLHLATINTQTASQPSYFAVDNSAGNVLQVYVYPTPDVQRTLQLTMIVPQDRLDDDDLDVTIKVPVRPIYVGTVWYALEDRGEELGPNATFSELRFNQALDDAFSRDSAEAGDSLELVPV